MNQKGKSEQRRKEGVRELKLLRILLDLNSIFQRKQSALRDISDE
jgi:hypothetical protein